jgi:hypothetical protein
MRALYALLLLGACAQAVAPVAPDNSASVTVSSGGIMGWFTSTVYVDDRVLAKRFDQGKDSPETTTVVQGAYARAVAVIAAEGAATLAHAKPGPEVCMDYGTDLVRIEPPTAAFDKVASDCPDAAVTALISHVLAAMAPAE